jgi:hypothetical protein
MVPPRQTTFSPHLENLYQAWSESNRVPQSNDYDMRGYFMDIVMGKQKDLSDLAQHYPDTYKLPNHPSFSNESIYSTGKDDPYWIENPAPYNPPTWKLQGTDIVEQPTQYAQGGRVNFDTGGLNYPDYYNITTPPVNVTAPMPTKAERAEYFRTHDENGNLIIPNEFAPPSIPGTGVKLDEPKAYNLPYEYSLPRLGVAGIEALTTLGTGALAYPLGAVYGLGSNLLSGKYGTAEGARLADEEAAKAAEAMTYMPRTKTGRQAVEGLGDIFEALKIPPIIPELAGLQGMRRPMPDDVRAIGGKGLELAEDIRNFKTDYYNSQSNITRDRPTLGASLQRKAQTLGDIVAERQANEREFRQNYSLFPSMAEAGKSYIVKPEGNLNLTPIVRAESLKGPDKQTVGNFMRQVQSIPGVTKAGIAEALSHIKELDQTSLITKSEFEKLIPASQYSKVDLSDSAGVNQHLLDEADELIHENADLLYENISERLGLDPYENDNAYFLQQLDAGEVGLEDAPPGFLEAFGDTPENEILNAFDSIKQEEHTELVNQYVMERMEDADEPQRNVYQYDQRLRANYKNADEGDYFEIGVAHPEAQTEYHHYNGEENLFGHARGSFIRADASPEDRLLIVPYSETTITAKPNSVVIEEIQTDSLKGEYKTVEGQLKRKHLPQKGILNQANSTVFKAAIQHALEGGADTVYLPTAKTVASHKERSLEEKQLVPVYDKQVVEEGLRPLLKVPGVTARKLEGYWEIDFSPEAKEFILNLEGQTITGYNEGGVVHMEEGGLWEGYGAPMGENPNYYQQQEESPVHSRSTANYGNRKYSNADVSWHEINTDVDLFNKYGAGMTKQGSVVKMHNDKIKQSDISELRARYATDDGTQYAVSRRPLDRTWSVRRSDPRDQSSISVDVSPDYKGISYTKNFAEGGLVYDHGSVSKIADELLGSMNFAEGGPALSVGRGEKLPVSRGAGLTAKGRAKANRATGSNLKAPAPHPKNEADANRRKSFCARMSGMPGPMEDDNGDPTRKAASLKRWNC